MEQAGASESERAARVGTPPPPSWAARPVHGHIPGLRPAAPKPELGPPGPRAEAGRALTNVVLLEQPVQARQVLDDKVPQDALVRLHTQQGGAEVGGGEQVLDDGAHHPEGVVLLQEEQEAGSHLVGQGHEGHLPRSPCPRGP